MDVRLNLSRKDPLMKVKKYILIITLVLTIGISYAGSALACDGPPEDTARVSTESPTI
jgi:hypothetical protein